LQELELIYFLPFCTEYVTGPVTLTECDDGSFCCGDLNSTCCDAGQGTMLNGFGQIIATTPANVTTQPTVTATPTPVASSNGMSKTATILLATFIPILFILLLLALLWVLLERRKRIEAETALHLAEKRRPDSDIPVPQAALVQRTLSQHPAPQRTMSTRPVSSRPLSTMPMSARPHSTHPLSERPDTGASDGSNPPVLPEYSRPATMVMPADQKSATSPSTPEGPPSRNSAFAPYYA
jgi:hypothetical protein